MCVRVVVFFHEGYSLMRHAFFSSFQRNMDCVGIDFCYLFIDNKYIEKKSFVVFINQVNVYERHVEMFSIQFDLFNVEVLALN